MIFQDPMTSLNPVFTVGDQIGEAIRAHFPRLARRGPRASLAAAPGSRHSGPGVAARRLSPPAERRHAAAGDDRHRARGGTRDSRGRRADHRARRHGPGTDPRGARPTAGQSRHGGPPDHPRPRHRGRPSRSRGGHVRRTDRRGGTHRPALRQPIASLHAGSLCLGPAHPGSGAAPHPDSRERAARRRHGRPAAGSGPAAPRPSTSA